MLDASPLPACTTTLPLFDGVFDAVASILTFPDVAVADPVRIFTFPAPVSALPLFILNDPVVPLFPVASKIPPLAVVAVLADSADKRPPTA